MDKLVIRPTWTGVFPRLPDGIYQVALGNMSQFEVAVIHNPGKVFVGIVGKKCYTFTNSHHEGYIEEKLGVDGSDATNMADFIACQLGLLNEQGEVAIPRGHYMPHLCDNPKPQANA